MPLSQWSQLNQTQPSLADLYENVENSENDFTNDILGDLKEIKDLKEQFEKMELEILKSKELDWNQEQSIKNSLEQSKEEIQNLEKIAEAFKSAGAEAVENYREVLIKMINESDRTSEVELIEKPQKKDETDIIS